MAAPLSIQDALKYAHETLAEGNDNFMLEAALLLAHVLGVTRTHLHTRPEQLLRESQRQAFFDFIARRKAGEPVAYLLGHREFWSLDLIVNKHTLIPRPETESLVEAALMLIPQQAESHVLDLGTGSGAIALAIASERPQCKIIATDLCPRALEVARTNAERLNLSNVEFREGSWFTPFCDERFDIIVSNPPYVAEHDPHLAKGDLPAEPSLALVAGANGMEMLTAIAQQAPHYLQEGGWLLMEHGYDQAAGVAALLNKANYRHVRTWRDLAGHERITSGQRG
jgi:release factor glutamine methyltransferase